MLPGRFTLASLCICITQATKFGQITTAIAKGEKKMLRNGFKGICSVINSASQMAPVSW